MSCEGRRTKAYDNDLRWRMVYQVKVQNLRHREVARNLCVDQSTVSRTVALFDDTGDVKKRKYPSNPGTVNLTDYDKLVILETVIDQPGVFLRELQSKLESTTGTQVDVSTICRFLHATGFTRQKMVVHAIQRSEVLRSQYLLDMSIFRGHPDMLVFVDETGTDRRDCMRRFGYSLRGRPAVSRKLLDEVSKCQLLLECVVMAYWTYVQSRAVWVLKNFQSLLKSVYYLNYSLSMEQMPEVLLFLTMPPFTMQRE